MVLVAGALLVPVGARAQEKPTKVEDGKPAPDFTMTNIEGKEFKLSDRIGGEKNVVLMFSRASW